MRKANSNHNIFKMLGMLLLLTLMFTLIVSCDTTPPGTTSKTSTAKTTPTEPEIDGTPKGPGAANLTATARATPVAITCPNLTVSPASISGWKTYKDSLFPFQFAYPQSWHTSFENGEPDDHAIAIFPPGASLPFTGYAASAPEYLEVAFPLNANGDFSDPSQGTGVTQLSPLTVDSQQVKVYRLWEPECTEMEYFATGTFGHHDFEFHLNLAVMQGNSITTEFVTKAKQDTSYFLAMVRSFVYTG
jgi:hypothetical protein